MNPGILNRKIELQKNVTPDQTDEEGFLTPTWEVFARPWAEITAVSGSEKISAGGLIAKASMKFRIRYREGITTQHRVIYAQKAMNIVFVDDEDEAHRYLVLYCEVQENGG